MVPVAPVAAPPVPPAPVYPPPVAAPVAAPAPRPGRTAAIAISIALGALLVIGGLGAAIYFVAQSAISTLDSAEPDTPASPTDENEYVPIEFEPLVEGAPSNPSAVEPMQCADACFSQGMLSRAQPDRASINDLGLPNIESPFGVDSSSPDTEYTNSSRTWVSGEGEPEACFFTYLTSPVVATLGDRPETSTDQIDFLSYAYSEDEYSYLSMSSRLFGSSARAEEHMAMVHSLVPGCESYDIGTGQDFWTADVSPLPALDLPASVAATGWVEDGPFGRYYVIDLQRGNLVVRSTLGTDGAITETDFRSFVENYAAKLVELDKVN